MSADIQPGTAVRITSEGPHAATGAIGLIGRQERTGSSYPIMFAGVDSEPDWYQREDFELVTLA
jgi:hypothetical protein